MPCMRTLLAIVFAFGCTAAEPETIPLPRHILTNDGLVVLSRAGLGDGLLVDLIRHKRTQFDTSADALALLARHGLSENVLRAVVEKQEQVLLRKPRLSVTPVGPGPAVETAASVEMEPGEVVLMPGGGGRRFLRSSPDRWYKVTMR